MSTNARWPYAEAHRKASEEFRRLSPEQRRARMREAGVLGITPQVGDKVRVLGRLDTWRHGIIVGADRDGHGRVHVLHNDEQGAAVVGSLEELANGKRVEMVQRAPAGREYEVAARAMRLRGRQVDLASFDADQVGAQAPADRSPSPQALLGGLLAALGLAAVAIALSDDHEWDESVGRYRDSRGRFAVR